MQIHTKNVVIKDEQSVSEALDCGVGFFPIRIIVPSAIAGDTLGFQISNDNGVFRPMKHEGVEVTFDMAADDDSGLDPGKFAGVRWLKLVSLTGSTPEVQTADRTFQVVMRGY